MIYDSKNIKKFKFGSYKKTAITKAIQMKEDFIVNTSEGIIEGKRGDYLCIDNKGNPYPCDKAIFESSYIWA